VLLPSIDAVLSSAMHSCTVLSSALISSDIPSLSLKYQFEMSDVFNFLFFVKLRDKYTRKRHAGQSTKNRDCPA
jgi:hypothetical protein